MVVCVAAVLFGANAIAAVDPPTCQPTAVESYFRDNLPYLFGDGTGQRIKTYISRFDSCAAEFSIRVELKGPLGGSQVLDNLFTISTARDENGRLRGCVVRRNIDQAAICFLN